MAYYFAPDCYSCKHRISLRGLWHVCRAFPKGIPDEIFWESEKHDHIHTNQDNDIIFEDGEKLPLDIETFEKMDMASMIKKYYKK